jgi:MerR family transcriptional regulator, copper efflux regulator
VRWERALANVDTFVLRLGRMPGLTIQEAAATTSWSPRMLRYLERVGLLATPRSNGGYRVYGAAELQRLRTLRELLDLYQLGPSEVAFAKRLRDDPKLADAVATWLETRPTKPDTVSSSDWLRFEHDKCRKLLASAAA